MNSFEEAGLKPEILSAIAGLGYECPTAIQEQVIPFLLENKGDLIALAQTGTGKTAAFGLPMIQRVDTSLNQIQALVLCPTRELCIQISADLLDYSTKIEDLRVVPVYGGASIENQVKQLRVGAQIVVGTPGRVLDLINRKRLHLENIAMLVLDEADEMLNMGFKDDLDAILADTPKGKQSMLFSATMSKDIANIARRYMDDPHEISVGKQNTGADNVAHIYYMVHARNKYEALKRIADFNPRIYGIVFCRTRTETKEIAEKLVQDGYNADALHGDLSQIQRDHVMGRFRTKHLQLLVATDVAARGLDVDDLTHIINFSLPDDNEVYIHRSGRTGRIGKSGICVSIIHTRETGAIRNLEKMMSKRFEQRQVPTGSEVCEKQLFNLIEKVERIEVDEVQIEPFMKAIYKKLSWLEREDMIKRFVSVEFNRFLAYYKNSQDLNVVREREEAGRRERPERSRDRDRDRDRDQDRTPDRDRKVFSRFHINVGSNQQIQPANLIGIINDTQRLRGAQIGRIEILRNFSFFELDAQYAAEVEKAFQGMEYKGVTVIVTPANDRPANTKPEGSTYNPKSRPWDSKSNDRPSWKGGEGKSFAERPSFKRNAGSKDSTFKRKRKSNTR